jgi:predicted nucleotidyltransferase
MNINNKLVTFAQQDLVLARNDTERDKIKASLGQLEKVLKAKIGANVKEFVRFGSFTRNTILPRKYDPMSDVDLMVVFNTSLSKLTPGWYRQKLYNMISEAYPLSISKKDFPVVKLELNHIMFDIVPAYSEQGSWSNRNYYYIPDARDGWRETTPNDVNESLQQENQRYGNNTVRNVIRLCKHWNAMKNYPFESYLMEKEILRLNFYNENTYSGFLYALKNLAYYNVSGVSQAIDSINNYKGGLFNEANEGKQFQWLQRLLPGLN